MIQETVKVKHAGGLEGRKVALLVQMACQYESRIYVIRDNKKVNAKSLLGMTSMIFSENSEVTVSADGADEAAAVANIEKYLSHSGK
ncbi:MAG: HPr family phosphocarrier protein [Lachnospiraceae bacterium]|nr:HPr family phosphocarrier protein [Lachnospiraceae bacterium]